jgi:hypothetical protein
MRKLNALYVAACVICAACGAALALADECNSSPSECAGVTQCKDFEQPVPGHLLFTGLGVPCYLTNVNTVDTCDWSNIDQAQCCYRTPLRTTLCTGNTAADGTGLFCYADVANCDYTGGGR